MSTVVSMCVDDSVTGELGVWVSCKESMSMWRDEVNGLCETGMVTTFFLTCCTDVSVSGTGRKCKFSSSAMATCSSEVGALGCTSNIAVSEICGIREELCMLVLCELVPAGRVCKAGAKGWARLTNLTPSPSFFAETSGGEVTKASTVSDPEGTQNFCDHAAYIESSGSLKCNEPVPLGTTGAAKQHE